MIEVEQLKEIVSQASGDDDCAKELAQAIDAGLSPLSPIGHLRAHKALFIFRGRMQSARAAGVDVHGIDRLLARLAKRPPDETVLLSHWTTDTRLFTAFVSDADKSFIGCISVPKRARDADVDWSTGVPVGRETT